MSLALMLMAAQAAVTVPSGDGKSVDEKIAILANAEIASRSRYEWSIYNDAAMRAEIRRVGIGLGCEAVAIGSTEMVARHAGALRPHAAQAIRNIIPKRHLAEARFISFIAHPFTMYSSRVHGEVDRLAATEMAAAREDMRRLFLAQTRTLPDSGEVAEEAVKPKADISAALSLNGRWDFNVPAHLAMACLEQRVHPHLRPVIMNQKPVEPIAVRVEPPAGAKPE